MSVYTTAGRSHGERVFVMGVGMTDFRRGNTGVKELAQRAARDALGFEKVQKGPLEKPLPGLEAIAAETERSSPTAPWTACVVACAHAQKRQVEGARVGIQHNLGLGGACVVAIYRRA